MNRSTITPDNEQHWLELRTRDLTSTEISALFGLSPYLTEFELYHRKVAGEVVRLTPSERMVWGTRLEASIAAGAAEDRGWKVQPRKGYTRIDDLRIGSSFDFEIEAVDARGAGLLEVKNVDGAAFARNWIEHADGSIEAPAHIELQLQHQLYVADLAWGAIAVLVGGNTLHVLERARDHQVASAIRAKAAAFWAQVDAGTPPQPNYERDAEFILQHLRANANEGEVVQADTDLEVLLTAYRSVSDQLNELEQSKEELKARVLDRVGTASKIVANVGTVTCGVVKDSPGKLITPDLVGTYVGARKGYRQFRFNVRKEK